MSDITMSGEAGGFEQLAVGTVAVALTAGSYAPSTGLRFENAVITAEAAPIRWRCDGGAPGTAAVGVGHLLGTASGESLELNGFNNLVNFRAVRSTGTGGTIQVTYFR